MSVDPKAVPATDEYARRARYLHWCLEAFLAADRHPEAVPITCRMLREKAKSDDVAASVDLGLFAWVARWWNPYRVDSTDADRYGVIAELRDELRMAQELAAL